MLCIRVKKSSLALLYTSQICCGVVHEPLDSGSTHHRNDYDMKTTRKLSMLYAMGISNEHVSEDYQAR